MLHVCVTTLIAQQTLTKAWASYWKCKIKWQITYTCLILKTGWVYNKFCETSKISKCRSSKLRKFASKTGAIGHLRGPAAVCQPLVSFTSLWRLSVLVARMTGRSWQFAQLTVTCHQPKGRTGNQTLRGNENHASALGYVWKQHHVIHTDELGAGRVRNSADRTHLHIVVTGSAVNTMSASEIRCSLSLMKGHTAKWKSVGSQASELASFQESINWCSRNKVGILCTL